MRFFVIALFCLCFRQGVFAQEDSTIRVGWILYEKMPTYPGGDVALVNYLKSVSNYKSDSLGLLCGRVYVEFVVDTLGNICDEKVLKGIYPELDSIALNIVRAMPNWEPGEQGGRPVSMSYRLPLTFNIKEGAFVNYKKRERYWQRQGLDDLKKS